MEADVCDRLILPPSVEEDTFPKKIPMLDFKRRSQIRWDYRQAYCIFVHFLTEFPLATRNPRVHGSGDVRGEVRRVRGCVRLWHVHAGDGHLWVPLLWVPERSPDIPPGDQRKYTFWMPRLHMWGDTLTSTASNMSPPSPPPGCLSVPSGLFTRGFLSAVWHEPQGIQSHEGVFALISVCLTPFAWPFSLLLCDAAGAIRICLSLIFHSTRKPYWFYQSYQISHFATNSSWSWLKLEQ